MTCLFCSRLPRTRMNFAEVLRAETPNLTELWGPVLLGAYRPVISYRTQSVSVSYFTVLQYCSHCGSCSRSGDLLLYRSRETRVPSVAEREQGARDTLYGVSRMTHVEPCHERYGPGTRLRTQERAQRAEFSSITNGSSPPSSRVRRPRSHSSRSWPRPPPPQWHS